jgi:hypothetical protein
MVVLWALRVCQRRDDPNVTTVTNRTTRILLNRGRGDPSERWKTPEVVARKVEEA